MINTAEEAPYSNGRLIVRRDGYVIVYTQDSKHLTPFYCETCGFLMRTQTDEESYREMGCCSVCAVNWAYPDRKSWNEGVRPSREAAQLVPRQPITTRLTF